MGAILTKMAIEKEKLVTHGYKILNGGDLNENSNFKERKIFMHGYDLVD